MYSLVIFGVITSNNACSNKRVNWRVGLARMMWAMNVLHLSHRPCTTWSWSLRWRRWRSSRSAWNTGAPWRQSCTASPPSLAAPPHSSWAPSPCRKCLPADSSTTLSCPRWVKDLLPVPAPYLVLNTEPRLLNNIVYFRVSHKSL